MGTRLCLLSSKVDEPEHDTHTVCYRPTCRTQHHSEPHLRATKKGHFQSDAVTVTVLLHRSFLIILLKDIRAVYENVSRSGGKILPCEISIDGLVVKWIGSHAGKNKIYCTVCTRDGRDYPEIGIKHDVGRQKNTFRWVTRKIGIL